MSERVCPGVLFITFSRLYAQIRVYGDKRRSNALIRIKSSTTNTMAMCLLRGKKERSRDIVSWDAKEAGKQRRTKVKFIIIGISHRIGMELLEHECVSWCDARLISTPCISTLATISSPVRILLVWCMRRMSYIAERKLKMKRPSKGFYDCLIRTSYSALGRFFIVVYRVRPTNDICWMVSLFLDFFLCHVSNDRHNRLWGED